MMTKNYATLPNVRQTHYRQLENPQADTTLIMLHASPMSSELMVPTMNALSGLCTLVAPDTPGYGQSDPLTEEQLAASEDLSPYVEWLSNFMDAIHLKQIGLYGSATGAQIAIEFAKAHPQKTRFLILDNAAHFTDAEREQIMTRYFPDLSPREDGSHLRKIWHISESLFQWFPWYQQDEAHRISSMPPPLAAVQATAKAYLQAGVDYAQAYRRAFMNEDAGRLMEVRAPTRVVRWQGSVIKKYCDRFDEYPWPEHIRMCHCGQSIDERMEAIRQAVTELVS